MKWSRVIAAAVLVAAVLFGLQAPASAEGTDGNGGQNESDHQSSDVASSDGQASASDSSGGDAAGEGPACTGRELVDLMDTRIYARTDGVDHAGAKWATDHTWNMVPEIPAGTYEVELGSWDFYENRSADPAQPHEIWSVEFMGVDDVVLAGTAKTTDIADGVDHATQVSKVGQITLAQPAKAVHASHGAKGSNSANSVMMSCIGLTLVGDASGPASSAAPDTTGTTGPVAPSSNMTPAIDDEYNTTPGPSDSSTSADGTSDSSTSDNTDSSSQTPDSTPASGSCTGDHHDVNGQCVLTPNHGGPWPANPCESGWHDDNGSCVNNQTGCAADMHDEDGVCVADCEAAAQGGKCSDVVDDNSENPTPGTGTGGEPGDEVPTEVGGLQQVPAPGDPDGSGAVGGAGVDPDLAATGGFASTWMGWAFGILLAGAAMGLSARAVRSEP